MFMKKDFSLSAVTAGFLAVLISYAGPLVIFFQAGQSAHVSAEMMLSWVWAISIGAELSGILLSWWLKVPVNWGQPGRCHERRQSPGSIGHHLSGHRLRHDVLGPGVGVLGRGDWRGGLFAAAQAMACAGEGEALMMA